MGLWACGGRLFSASALSKEIGLIFPLIWLVLALTERKRGLLLGAAGLTIAVLIAYLGLRLPAEHIAPPPQPERRYSLGRSLPHARFRVCRSDCFPWRLHGTGRRDAPVRLSPESLNSAAWRELQSLLEPDAHCSLLCALATRRHRTIFVPLLLRSFVTCR
jgi:hypothetical protein